VMILEVMILEGMILEGMILEGMKLEGMTLPCRRLTASPAEVIQGMMRMEKIGRSAEGHVAGVADVRLKTATVRAAVSNQVGHGRLAAPIPRAVQWTRGVKNARQMINLTKRVVRRSQRTADVILSRRRGAGALAGGVRGDAAGGVEVNRTEVKERKVSLRSLVPHLSRNRQIQTTAKLIPRQTIPKYRIGRRP